MYADTPGLLRREDLRSLFVKTGSGHEKIGLEIENGVVDPATGRAAPYFGKAGIESLLQALIVEFGGIGQFDGGYLTGVRCENGMQFALEHGGAVEYISVPVDDLATAVEDMWTNLERLSDVARTTGLAILPGANLPFNRIENVSWVPKPQTALAREFFSRLGDAGIWGPTVMALTLSTQVTVDYLAEDDFAHKLRMQVAASPVVAAMFVNSPLEGGELTGLLSRRSQCWLKTDPRRCGVLPPALQETPRVEDFIEWALGLPMIYRRTPDGKYLLAPDRPFSSLLTEGFDDGTMLTQADWVSHLSQVWTDVRVRQTLELRAPDGPPYPYIPAVPALWIGLTYHPESCAAAWRLLKDYSLAEYRAAMQELPARGLATTLAGDSMRDLGRELVRLGRSGLQARVDAGFERPAVLDYLAPIEEVLHTGTTFAERSIHRWEGEFGRRPDRYVAAYRV